MSKKVKFIVKADIHGYKSGQTVLIEMDKNGTPIDRLWRRRLKDAKIDGCIVEAPQPKKPTSAKKGSE